MLNLAATTMHCLYLARPSWGSPTKDTYHEQSATKQKLTPNEQIWEAAPQREVNRNQQRQYMYKTSCPQQDSVMEAFPCVQGEWEEGLRGERLKEKD